LFFCSCVGDIEDKEDIKDVEYVEDAEDMKDVEYVEDAEDSMKDIEYVEDMEVVKDLKYRYIPIEFVTLKDGSEGLIIKKIP